MRIHALLFFLLAQPAFALYGAKTAVPNRHLVNLKVGNDTFCQGVLIAQDRVLTTGHCIEGMGSRLRETSLYLTYYPETVSVVSGPEKVSAKTITLAPTYFDSSDFKAEDLAVIELARPLKKAQVLPIAGRNELIPGTAVTLTSGTQEISSKILRRVQGLGGLIIIADGSRSGICQGDSGGAMIVTKNGRKFLAGILAAQNEGCLRKHTIGYFPRQNLD